MHQQPRAAAQRSNPFADPQRQNFPSFDDCFAALSSQTALGNLGERSIAAESPARWLENRDAPNASSPLPKRALRPSGGAEGDFSFIMLGDDSRDGEDTASRYYGNDTLATAGARIHPAVEAAGGDVCLRISSSPPPPPHPIERSYISQTQTPFVTPIRQMRSSVFHDTPNAELRVESPPVDEARQQLPPRSPIPTGTGVGLPQKQEVSVKPEGFEAHATGTPSGDEREKHAATYPSTVPHVPVTFTAPSSAGPASYRASHGKEVKSSSVQDQLGTQRPNDASAPEAAPPAHTVPFCADGGQCGSFHSNVPALSAAQMRMSLWDAAHTRWMHSLHSHQRQYHSIEHAHPTSTKAMRRAEEQAEELIPRYDPAQASYSLLDHQPRDFAYYRPRLPNSFAALRRSAQILGDPVPGRKWAQW